MKTENLTGKKNLGGSGNDFLQSIRYTSDGGYILGGSSDSPVNKVKKDACRGKQDYWVVKLDASGEIQWQKTLGGTEDDRLVVIRPLKDHQGYILGGTSSSSASNEKKKLHEETRIIGLFNWMHQERFSGKKPWEGIITMS